MHITKQHYLKQIKTEKIVCTAISQFYDDLGKLGIDCKQFALIKSRFVEETNAHQSQEGPETTKRKTKKLADVIIMYVMSALMSKRVAVMQSMRGDLYN